jgi:3-oxoacyl-[acyl-carrier-protein] synthase-3
MGMYLPERVVTDAQIANDSGIEEQGVYNDTYGHAGEQDSIINIIEGQQQSRLKDGDLMVIVAAGVGYVWGVACGKWGPCESRRDGRN